MDKKQLITWVAGVVAKGIAWFLSVKLGLGAAESDSYAAMFGQGLAAIAIAGVSTYVSVRERKKLLVTPAPSQEAAGRAAKTPPPQS